MVNPIAILRALANTAPAQRIGQEFASADKDTLPNPLGGPQVHYNPLRAVPVLGGLINRTVNTPLHSLGLINEGAAKVGNTLAGEMVLLAALASKYGGDDPNSQAGQAAAAALAQGPLHPGRAIEAVRNGPYSAAARAAGVLEMAANPLNYTGSLARTGEALQAAGTAPRLGAALATVGHIGEGANQIGTLPLAIFPGARRALLEGLGGVAATAREAPLAGVLTKLGALEERPPLPASPFPLPPPMPRALERGNVPARDLIKGIGLGPELPPVQDVPLPPALGPDLPTRGNLPADQLIPGIGRNGSRGIGPERPIGPPIPLPTDQPAPIQSIGDLLGAARGTAAPTPLERLQGVARRLGLDTPKQPVTPIPLPPGAVTRAEERAARDLGPLQDVPGVPEGGAFPALAGDRRAQLGALSSDEIQTLLGIAYPGERAQANAILAHPDPADLADAALGHITRDNRALATLARTDDALARKLAYLPEPGAAPTLTPPAGAGATQLPNAATSTPGTYEDFLNAARSVTGDLPLPASDFWAKRLGGADVPAFFRRAADEGILGELPHEPGRFAVRPATPNVAAATNEVAGATPHVAAESIGGDIAAGGGGAKFVVPGATLALRGAQDILAHPGSAAGGLVGAGLGAGIGAATNEDDRVGGAIKGAAAGAALGYGGTRAAGAFAPAADEVARAVGDRFTDTQADPAMWAAGLKAGFRGLQERGLVSTVHGPKDAWDAFWAQWRAQTVNTIKQLPQDALTERVTIEGIAKQEFPGLTDQALRRTQGALMREREAGVAPLQSQLPYFQKLRALGLGDLIADDQAVQDLVGTDFGGSLTEANRKQFGPVGRAVAGGLIGLGTAAKSVNPLAAVYGPARGLVAPFVDDTIRFMNGVQHDKFRLTLGDLALSRDIPHLANDFLSELARTGHDVRPLERLGGYFVPEDVARVAGPQAAEDWRGLVTGLVKAQGDRIAFLAGDFRDKLAKGYAGNVTTGDKIAGTIEQNVGRAAPFSRWGIRYAPVLAEIAARHPRAASLVMGELQREQADAKQQGKRSYQSGVTITDRTPLVGLAARARNGGAAGSLTVNPLGALVPYGGMLGPGEDLPADATAYQRITNVADRVGLAPNPVIQSLAYISGKDYRVPGNLSRTAGLEAGVGAIPAAARLAGVNVPDLPQIPSGRTLLDAGRELLAPVTGEHAVSSTEPEVRRYAELVLAHTQKPLMDPANRSYLDSMGEPDNQLWNLAVVQARAGGAATNATGLVSPVQSSAQTNEAAAAQAATAAGPLPGDYAISQLPKGQQAGARAALDRLVAQNPIAATYRNISPTARRQQQVAEWEQRNARMRQLAPSLYAERRKAFVESLR